MIRSKTNIQWLSLLFFLFFLSLLALWSKLEGIEELRSETSYKIEELTRKKESLDMDIREAEMQLFRYKKRLESLDAKVRDRVRQSAGITVLPTIFFITPTAFRPEQKADLTRLSNTLSQVASLLWIVVEDATSPTQSLTRLFERSGVKFVHLAVPTPPSRKMSPSQPNWLLPRGVPQRNIAIDYIRNNMGSMGRGVVYFGDDDNAYDLRLFEEIRLVRRAGTWPVGLVGGLIAERLSLHPNGTVKGHNSKWKPERPFPLDMAAFAINVTLLIDNRNAGFEYKVQRGYQESHFLQSCGLRDIHDLEPLAHFGTEVLVWHTRTERSKLDTEEEGRLKERGVLSEVERDALGID